jgi:hypothetical protein
MAVSITITNPTIRPVYKQFNAFALCCLPRRVNGIGLRIMVRRVALRSFTHYSPAAISRHYMNVFFRHNHLLYLKV